MPATMDMLRSEHRNISRLLDMLDRQFVLFEKTGEPDYELLAEIVDYLRSFPDLYHHPKEDLVLERLKARNPKKAAEVGDLDKEHEEVGERLNTFTRAVAKVLLGTHVSRDAFLLVAREFVDGERKHMASEERVFFPAAMQSLTDDDWREIDQRVGKFSDPLRSTRAIGRFELLRRELASMQRVSGGSLGAA